MPIRDATPTDVPALLDVMFVDPPIEAVRLARGADRARRFQAQLFDRAFDDGSIVLAAVDDGTPVGFAWMTSSDHSEMC